MLMKSKNCRMLQTMWCVTVYCHHAGCRAHTHGEAGHWGQEAQTAKLLLSTVAGRAPSDIARSSCTLAVHHNKIYLRPPMFSPNPLFSYILEKFTCREKKSA